MDAGEEEGTERPNKIEWKGDPATAHLDDPLEQDRPNSYANGGRFGTRGHYQRGYYGSQGRGYGGRGDFQGGRGRFGYFRPQGFYRGRGFGLNGRGGGRFDQGRLGACAVFALPPWPTPELLPRGPVPTGYGPRDGDDANGPSYTAEEDFSPAAERPPRSPYQIDRDNPPFRPRPQAYVNQVPPPSQPPPEIPSGRHALQMPPSAGAAGSARPAPVPIHHQQQQMVVRRVSNQLIQRREVDMDNRRPRSKGALSPLSRP